MPVLRSRNELCEVTAVYVPAAVGLLTVTVAAVSAAWTAPAPIRTAALVTAALENRMRVTRVRILICASSVGDALPAQPRTAGPRVRVRVLSGPGMVRLISAVFSRQCSNGGMVYVPE